MDIKNDIQKTLRQVEQWIAKLEPQLQTSLRKNSELQSKVANLKDEVKTVSETNLQLKNVNDDLERIHVDQKNRISVRGTMIDNLTTKNNLLEEENKKLEDDIYVLRYRLDFCFHKPMML